MSQIQNNEKSDWGWSYYTLFLNILSKNWLEVCFLGRITMPFLTSAFSNWRRRCRILYFSSFCIIGKNNTSGISSSCRYHAGVSTECFQFFVCNYMIMALVFLKVFSCSNVVHKSAWYIKIYRKKPESFQLIYLGFGWNFHIKVFSVTFLKAK